MEPIGRKLHKDRDEILNFCNHHKRIHVFGAGRAGELMLRYLAEEGIQVLDVLVSPGHVQGDSFQGIPLKELKEDIWEDGDGVIVSVGIWLRKEIFDLLTEFGINEQDLYIQRIYSLSVRELLIHDVLLVKSNGEKETFFHKYKELDQLGEKYETDKCSTFHNYLDKYEFFFKELKDEPIHVLELGVYNGGSLQTWETYFEKAQIYGVDVEERCMEYGRGRCHVILQDLGDENLMEKLSFISPDIIIDDASHYTSHQIKALYHLFPTLKSGGIYIVEDLGTNFKAYRNRGYQDAIVSCYEFCKAIADVVTSGEYLALEKMHPACVLLKGEIEFLAGQVSMISFIHESCIMIKK